MKNAHELQKWFKKHIKESGVPYTLDKNQAKIVLDSHKHTLVTARTGSGKTRTIVAKAIYLLTYLQIPASQIIIFSFNRKARAEINDRLLQIKFDDQPILPSKVELATTFHAFAYKILGGKEVIGPKLMDENQQNQILNQICIDNKLQTKSDEIKQFITRAEQQYFDDYAYLDQKIDQISEENEVKEKLLKFNLIFKEYRKRTKRQGLTNFNQIMADAATQIRKNGPGQDYKYIFVDEYQDFSKLFLNLIKAILSKCNNPKLLAVGDDWQSINRFAGSNVDYFLHFEKYFKEDYIKLFIPTNYRSGKRIVKNANLFMSRALHDFNGCKSGNKLKAKIFYKNMKYGKARKNKNIPILIENYLETTLKIVQENPDKSIKILSRNNDLHIPDWSLEKFVKLVKTTCAKRPDCRKLAIDSLVTYSTIHRSKGLESDIVILLEIDENKFPAPDKTGGLYKVFGDNQKTLFEDEARLFYVALTRPKEKLFILSKTTKINRENRKYNFFSYLDENYLEEVL